jgi:hypothetical protein
MMSHSEQRWALTNLTLLWFLLALKTDGWFCVGNAVFAALNAVRCISLCVESLEAWRTREIAK